jgi:hypothetical protein
MGKKIPTPVRDVSLSGDNRIIIRLKDVQLTPGIYLRRNLSDAALVFLENFFI